MGQAKRRGTPDERRALAEAWNEAIREDRERFPPPPRPRTHLHPAIAVALAMLPTHMR